MSRPASGSCSVFMTCRASYQGDEGRSVLWVPWMGWSRWGEPGALWSSPISSALSHPTWEWLSVLTIASEREHAPPSSSTSGHSLKYPLGHSSILLAWETPWTEEPGGLQSTGLQRVRHDLVTKRHQQNGQVIKSLLFLSSIQAI